MRHQFAAACTTLLLASAPAQAAESAYTSVDFAADCRGETEADGSGSWTCKGYKGTYPHG